MPDHWKRALSVFAAGSSNGAFGLHRLPRPARPDAERTGGDLCRLTMTPQP